MSTTRRNLAWGVVLGLTGVLLASCGTGSSSPSSHHPTPQPSAVSLHIQFPSSHSSNPLTVVVSNGEAQPVSAQDHQTECTILLAEQQTGGRWHPLRNCAVMTPTRRHLLPPGQTLIVPLQVTTWPAGTYRIKLEYALGQHVSPTKTVYSASFVLPLT